MSNPEQSLPPFEAWIELPDKSTIVLKGDCHFGRIEGNEIVNPDSRISRRHSVVRREGNHYVLVDLGSTNGTFLNDSRIYKPTRLKDGDVIMVGALKYHFCQPVDTDVVETTDSSVGRTEVVVAKIFCWMVVIVSPEAPGPAATAWSEKVRRILTDSGAGVKRLREGAWIGHWRERRAKPEKVGAAVMEIAWLTTPTGARVALHHGAVRVGPTAVVTEENLLGAEVSFTHKLETTALELGVKFIASEPAVLSLNLQTSMRPLAQGVRDLPGSPALFTVATQ